MLTKKVEIQLANGLEARPVAMLVQVASQHDSTIYIQSAGKRVNAKSIMGIIAFNPTAGMDVAIRAEGSDEESAIEQLETFLKC